MASSTSKPQPAWLLAGLCIFGIFAALCVIRVAVELVVGSPVDRADKKWASGQKDAAVSLYVAEIEKSQPSKLPRVYERVVEYYLDRRDMKQVDHFLYLAIQRKVELAPASDEVRKEYADSKAVAETIAASEKQQAEARSKATAERVDKIGAWTYAEEFVKRYLKSPSTASFGSTFGEYQDPMTCVKSLGGGKYLVKGWVDSQNGFGATVRSDFVLTIKDDGNGKSWSLIGEPAIVTRQ